MKYEDQKQTMIGSIGHYPIKPQHKLISPTLHFDPCLLLAVCEGTTAPRGCHSQRVSVMALVLILRERNLPYSSITVPAAPVHHRAFDSHDRHEPWPTKHRVVISRGAVEDSSETEAAWPAGLVAPAEELRVQLAPAVALALQALHSS